MGCEARAAHTSAITRAAGTQVVKTNHTLQTSFTKLLYLLYVDELPLYLNKNVYIKTPAKRFASAFCHDSTGYLVATTDIKYRSICF
jgi:hypothetical protein